MTVNTHIFFGPTVLQLIFPCIHIYFHCCLWNGRFQWYADIRHNFPHMVYTYCFVCRTLYYVFLWTNISCMLLSRLNDTMGGSGNIFFSRLDWWGIFRCLRRMAWMFGRTLEYVITNGTLSFSFLSLYCRRSSRLSSSIFCSCSSINELLYPLFCKCVFISFRLLL